MNLTFAPIPFIEALKSRIAKGEDVREEIAGVVREFLGSKAGQLLASCLQALTEEALDSNDVARANGILYAVKSIRYLYTPHLPVGADSPEADTVLHDPLVGSGAAPFEFPTSTGA